jgi:S-adenosylmethionine hydrolase
VLFETAQAVVYVKESTISEFYQSYGIAPRGSVLALVDSNGRLELAVNQGSAARQLKIALDDRIELQIGQP